MALILLCKEDIDPTGSDVRCVRNDRICDMILQLYLSAQCQITPLTKNETGPHMEQFSPFGNPSLGFEPQIRKVAMCPQVVGENSHFGRGKGKKLS